MLELEYMRKQLGAMRLAVVAEDTGLSYFKLSNMRDNPAADPKLSDLKKLSDYLTGFGGAADETP